MRLLRCLLGLFVFIGVLAATCAVALALAVLLRFPLLLVALVVACWLFSLLCRQLNSFFFNNLS